MKRPVLVAALLLLTASLIIEGSLDERVERTVERRLVVDYDDLVHDTIPEECVRIMNSSRIEYWRGTTIIHISDTSYRARDIEIVSWEFFGNEK